MTAPMEPQAPAANVTMLFTAAPAGIQFEKHEPSGMMMVLCQSATATMVTFWDPEALRAVLNDGLEKLGGLVAPSAEETAQILRIVPPGGPS